MTIIQRIASVFAVAALALAAGATHAQSTTAPGASVGASSSSSLSSSTQGSSSYNTYNGVPSGSASTTTAEGAFVVTRSDITGTSTVLTPAQVATANDLAAYARSVMTEDPNISRIESNGSSVSVSYDEPAQFLGVVPVTATIDTTVDSSGKVSVTYPWWYDIFVKDDQKAQLATDLAVTAGAIARTSVIKSPGAIGATEATSSATLAAPIPPSLGARLVSAIRSVMASRFETSTPSAVTGSTSPASSSATGAY